MIVLERIDGAVERGTGEGTWWAAEPWFRGAVRQAFGFEPFAGTLNIRLARESAPLEASLLQGGTVLVPPSRAFCCALLLPVQVVAPGPADAVVVRPLVPGYEPAKVELIAATRLRTALSLEDGDAVAFVPGAPAEQRWLTAPDGMPQGALRGATTLRLELSGGPLNLWLGWTATEHDVSVVLYGGEPHVGAVALAIPRPSLRDAAKRSATSSVLTLTGHKDDVLARAIAEGLAARLGRTAVVSAGVHIGPPGVFTAPVTDLDAIVRSVSELVGLVELDISGAAAGRRVGGAATR